MWLTILANLVKYKLSTHEMTKRKKEGFEYSSLDLCCCQNKIHFIFLFLIVKVCLPLLEKHFNKKKDYCMACL